MLLLPRKHPANDLEDLVERAFRNISEVAEELDVAQHVLRFWESRFAQIRPLRRSGRRYYRPEDVALIRGVRHLLHEDGYTVRGVRKLFTDRGIDYVRSVGTDRAAG